MRETSSYVVTATMLAITVLKRQSHGGGGVGCTAESKMYHTNRRIYKLTARNGEA